MIPYIKRYEPPRRLRIKNRIRLTIFILLLVCTLLTIFIPRKGSSQAVYKPFIVGYGDTYWEIAKGLQAQGYRPRADVRSIVWELVQKSGIKAHELKEGDTIYIPDWEGLR